MTKLPFTVEPADGRGRAYQFQALANYNAEVARGIVHTPEWEEYMRTEQQRFDVAHALPPCLVCHRPAEIEISTGDRRVHCCHDCLGIVSLAVKYRWIP